MAKVNLRRASGWTEVGVGTDPLSPMMSARILAKAIEENASAYEVDYLRDSSTQEILQPQEGASDEEIAPALGLQLLLNDLQEVRTDPLDGTLYRARPVSADYPGDDDNEPPTDWFRPPPLDVLTGVRRFNRPSRRAWYVSTYREILEDEMWQGGEEPEPFWSLELELFPSPGRVIPFIPDRINGNYPILPTIGSMTQRISGIGREDQNPTYEPYALTLLVREILEEALDRDIIGIQYPTVQGAARESEDAHNVAMFDMGAVDQVFDTAEPGELVLHTP